MKKKVTIWVDSDKYAKLKARLALLGKTITQWFDEAIDKITKENG